MSLNDRKNSLALPNENIAVARMPGHWLLARMGKRVLRPGGIGLTHHLLRELKLTADDDVVEFAPGLGVTARLALTANPRSYTAVERENEAAAHVRKWLDGTGCNRQVIVGLAQETGLPDTSASVVYGEAMLSMQGDTRKRQIVQEAFRLLRPGGRYGIHELCLLPDDLSPDEASAIRRAITSAIHHQAVPLRAAEWERLLESVGFEIESRRTVPMALLEPRRLLRDEGVGGMARFFLNMLRDGESRRRVKLMRETFRRYRHNLKAICLVVRKPAACACSK